MFYAEKVSQICQTTHFNGNVLIAKGNDILIQGGFGYSNFEQKTPFIPESIFRIGSITKQFTALCILQLVEQGLLRLDDPIDRFIEGVQYDYVVTIHHLLANSSGIPNFDVFANYDDLLASDNFHERMVKEVILKPPLGFIPGEKFEYSSSGYIILTYVIEIVSKMPYHQYLQKNVFSVVGMKNSGFHFIDKKIEHFVSLYELNKGEIVEAMNYDMRKASGAGGMYASINDLFLWGRCLIEETLISHHYADLMFKVQTPINETGGYGYGVISTHFEMNKMSHRSIYHPGNGPGVFAQNMLIDFDIQLILLSNINDKQVFYECFNQLNHFIKENLL